MPDLQQRLTQTARDLITKYGQTVIISNESGATFDPATGGTTGGSTVSNPAKAVIRPATRAALERLGTRFIAGEAATDTVKIATIETVSTYDIKVGSSLTDMGGNTWYITGFTGADDNDGGNIVIFAGLRK